MATATKTERVNVVIPFDRAERTEWKARHIGRGPDLEVLAREMQALEYLHSVRANAVGTVCAKLGFARAEADELLREVVAGW